MARKRVGGVLVGMQAICELFATKAQLALNPFTECSSKPLNRHSSHRRYWQPPCAQDAVCAIIHSQIFSCPTCGWSCPALATAQAKFC